MKVTKVIITVKFTNGCEQIFTLKPETKDGATFTSLYHAKDFIRFDTIEDKDTRIPFCNVMYYEIQKINAPIV